MSDVAFFTIIANNYAAYARALTESLASFHPASMRYIVVVDVIDHEAVKLLAAEADATVLLPIDFLPYEFTMGLAHSYDVTEFCTAVKPFALLHLLNLGHQRAVYLDPDILVLRSLTPDVLAPLEQATIVLTPHTTKPIPLDGYQPSEITVLLAGSYNLGFIGVRECEETRRFLTWWAERLERFCVNDVARGFFVDQRWIDLVPGLFPGTRILRHGGLNVAYWNLHARQLVSGNPAPMLATGEPLIFFHFSGFDATKPTVLSRHQNRIEAKDSPVLASLLQEYAARLDALGHQRSARVPYGYATFSDGTRIDSIVRALCREARERGVSFPDPGDADTQPSLLGYCNAAAAGENGSLPRLTRYLVRLYLTRPDLRAAFPDLAERDRQAFFDWVRHDPHHGLEPSFVNAIEAPTAEPIHTGPIVTVAGYFASESGVGEAGRAHVAAIRAAGCAVHLFDFSMGAAFSRAREGTSEGVLRNGKINLVCVNADQVLGFAETAGKAFFRGRYNIGSWYWELPEFPLAWRDRFDLFDEIWVGSEFVRSAVAAGSPIPVVRVPPIVAPPPVWDASKERFGFRKNAFTFLYFFDYLSVFERKNPLGAVDAFRRAFVGRNDVRFVIKSINSKHDFHSAKIFTEACSGDPRIEIRDTYLSRDEKNAMLTAADCYVSLHRAEGFGLTIAEAMYFGTPVVCTNWSGNVDFANKENAFVVQSPLIELDRDFGPYTAGQYWANPDLDAAADAMRCVVDDPLEAQRRAERARADIRRHYSADAIGAAVHERLQSLQDRIEALA